MDSDQVVLMAIQAVFTLFCAFVGSYIMWRIVGPTIVRKHGAEAIWKKFADLGAEGSEESPENAILHRAVSVQVAHMLMDVLKDLETPEGRQKYHPFAKALYSVVQASIFGTWGKIVQDLQEKGHDITGGGKFNLGGMPPIITGIAQKAFPGVDLGEVVQVMQWLGSQSSGGGSASGEMASPFGGGARSAGHSGGSHRGVTQ